MNNEGISQSALVSASQYPADSMAHTQLNNDNKT